MSFPRCCLSMKTHSDSRSWVVQHIVAEREMHQRGIYHLTWHLQQLHLRPIYKTVCERAYLSHFIVKEREQERQILKPRWYYLLSKQTRTSADQHSTQCSGTHMHVRTFVEPSGTGLWRDSLTSKITLSRQACLQFRVFWHDPHRHSRINL